MPFEDYSRTAGAKAIGARIRRLSERIDRESGQCYDYYDIRFEQRWFGIVNQLRLHQRMSVGELASALGITHVSVSQTRKSLEAEGLIESVPDAHDGRKSYLSLTADGRRLVEELTPLWSAMEQASEELCSEADGILRCLEQLEQALDAKSLTDRITSRLDRAHTPGRD